MKKPIHSKDGININEVHNSSINISGGDINNVSTNINTGIGNLIVSNVDSIFGGLYKALEKLPDGIEKVESREILLKLENEAKKGNQADGGRIQRWLRFLAETAPDVWQVAIETFMHPISGISLVFKKVAERAKHSSK